MRMSVLIYLMMMCAGLLWGQPAQQSSKPAKAPSNQEIETEQVGAPQTTPPPAPGAANSAGYMEPAQVKLVLHSIWLTEFRINDLLSEVHPDRWKMPDTAKQSLALTMETLRRSLAAQEEWRAQFEKRPDSLYLGFQTYVAISAVLPRLDGIAKSVSVYENPSLGAQYSQASGKLFDQQQALEPHLAYLLKNQDGLMLAAQNNLSACQGSLGYALKDQQGRATPMKNIAPVFKGTRRSHHATASSSAAEKSGAKGADPKTPDKAEQRK